MGLITLFLSEALISGYTCAASFAILTSQISFLLGLDRMAAAVDPGPFDTPRVSDDLQLGLVTHMLLWNCFLYYRKLLDTWNCYLKERLMQEQSSHLFFVLSSSL